MKCKYCGGDVSLDDHFCQHCGRPVDQAQRHRMEMEQYETEFEETKQEALEKISVASGGGFPVGIRLAIIGVLIAALVFMFANFDPYTVHERKEQRAAKKNYDAYIAQMEDYLENRDYATFSAFCRKHQLDYNKDYRNYRTIINAAMYYNSIYRALQELAFMTRERADRGYYVKELSKYVNNFYEGVGDDRYLDREEDPERVQEVTGEMEADLKVLFERYLGFSKEEADSLRELTQSKRTVLIEQALDKTLSDLTGNGTQDT